MDSFIYVGMIVVFWLFVIALLVQIVMKYRGKRVLPIWVHVIMLLYILHYLSVKAIVIALVLTVMLVLAYRKGSIKKKR